MSARGDSTRPGDRQRSPRPLLRYRIRSGRGSTDQPNAVGEGDLLSARFWAALVATAVGTGLAADALMAVLHAAQHVAYDYSSGDFQTAVERVMPGHRMIVLIAAGAFAGPAWYLLRKATPGHRSNIHAVLWDKGSDLSARRCIPSGLFSEVIVGMGASLGREAAPQMMGGVAGTLIGRWTGLSDRQRRMLLACGAGAGLSAVYNVPIGGALLTAELLFGRIELMAVLPALACSCLATWVSWLTLPDHPTYTGLPPVHTSASLLVFAVVAGLLAGVAAVAWIRLIAFVSHHRPQGATMLVTPLIAFAALGGLGWAYPQLLGNGRGITLEMFLGKGSLVLAAVLLIAKPLVTAACLGSGASGGLFTPTLSIGALLGSVLGAGWLHIWPGTTLACCALITAAAMIGASMQAPLAGIVLILELAAGSVPLAVPLGLATVFATAAARSIDGYSLYSARLPARPTRRATGSALRPR